MPRLTPVQVAAAAYIGGFTTEIADAVALAKVESGYNPTAISGDNYGLWQIRKSAHPDLFEGRNWANPADNARMANILFQRRAGIPNTDGGWKDWPAHGGPRFKLAQPEGKRAEKEFRAKVARGESPEAILGARRSDGRSPPEDQPGGDALRAVGVTGLPELGALARALTSGNTWMRVGQVLMGALLVTVGAVALTGLAGKSPAGRLARALT